MMNVTKLSEHIFKKGKFITPMNAELGDKLKLLNWHKDALPEFIWLGCFLKKYKRKEAFRKATAILTELNRVDSEIKLPAFSRILSLSDDVQNNFFNYICQIADNDIFIPLTILYPASDYPVFAEKFCIPNVDMKERQALLTELLKETYDAQSNMTTDIKFLILFYMIIQGRLHMLQSSMEILKKYPETDHEDEQMKNMRPHIRATYGAIGEMFLEENSEQPPVISKDFINEFWERVSIMSECKLNTIIWEDENANMKEYVEPLNKILQYLAEYLVTMEPINNKAAVIIGITTYSYKRFYELYKYNMSNSISARSIVRVLLEDYIMIKYLTKGEKTKPDIWQSFQEYGMGIYKEVVARLRDIGKEFPSSHIEPKFLEIIINLVKDEKFLNIDTSYFDKQNIREKAIAVGEKELWGRFYDYESSYEHGLWGSIVESSTLFCENPSHQFHLVPDVYDEQKLRSVWADSVMLMNKTVNFVNNIYQIPQNLLLEVNNYEEQLSKK